MVDLYCICGLKIKCCYIVVVLFKLKIEYLGNYGEDYIINDWFSEFKILK